jgi:hypothetical protein
MSSLVHNINLIAPPKIEKTLGYNGTSRWVAFYWEPEANHVMFQDGQKVGAANNTAWSIFLQHDLIVYDLQKYELQNSAEYWLLLDRQTRRFYIGKESVIQSLFDDTHSLSLLACLDGDRTQDYVQGLRERVDQLFEWWESFRLLHFRKFLTWIIGITLLSLGVNTLWRFSPQFNLKDANTVKPAIVPPLTANTCGIGGSNDLSFHRVINQEKKSGPELHLIGVYEASSDHNNNYNPTGKIQVKIAKGKEPIIVALSAHEPVEWQIINESNTPIEKIVLNGYYDQKVTGISQKVPIIEFSHYDTGTTLGDFRYQWQRSESQPNSPDLPAELEKLTQTKITSFQGCYRGTSFTIE